MTESAHAHDHELTVEPKTRRVLNGIAIGVALLVVAGMLLVGFGTDVEATTPELLTSDVYRARVDSVETGPCAGTTEADGVDCTVVTVQLLQGPDKGETREIQFSVDALGAPDLHQGDRIVLNYDANAQPGSEYQYADRERRRVLWVLAILFALAVVLLGRLRGLAALVGIAFSLVIILQFVLPAILEGHSPVLVAVLGSAAVAYIALYVAHGVNALTTVALIGTLAALGLTLLLSVVFTAFADFSGYASEEALVLGQLASHVDVNGLILAGIVIGALGALDDVTVTQASAVAEIRAANPSMSRPKLYQAGIRIGRDHIASTVNTLALAYAGAALPLMLLLILAHQSLGTVANSEVIATEIVRTLVGSIGLVASVPITTWLAAHVVSSPAPATSEPRSKPRRQPRVRHEEQPRVRGEEDFWK